MNCTAIYNVLVDLLNQKNYWNNNTLREKTHKLWMNNKDLLSNDEKILLRHIIIELRCYLATTIGNKPFGYVRTYNVLCHLNYKLYPLMFDAATRDNLIASKYENEISL